MARVIFLLTEEKIVLEINQSETRIACDAMFVNRSRQNKQYL
jgi:hypothetical protein